MRLRSTQLVFLMLLLCSVQMRQDCALHLIASVSNGARTASTEQQAANPATPRPTFRHTGASAQPVRRMTAPLLDRVSAPQRHAMAVNSFTGLLRA